MSIQLDFGGFDPSFLGTTIRFSNDRAFQFFKAYTQSSDPLPVSNLPRDERFEALAIASVISHEVRHFHDFLLTPYSAHVFRLRLQGLINLIQVLPYLFEESANCVPLPISRWCQFDEGRRKEALAWGLGPDSKPWSPVSLPRLNGKIDLQLKTRSLKRDERALEHLLRAAIYTSDRIQQFTNNPRSVRGKTSFQPWQVFELSGLLVQIQDLWLTYGQEETQFFIDYLLQTERNPYAGVLQCAIGMWDQAKLPCDWNLTSAVATWSLLGSYTRDGWNACPTERFVRLWDHLSNNGIDRWSGDFMQLFDTWSRQLNLSTVLEGLEDGRNTFQLVRESIDRSSQKFARTFMGGKEGELLRRVTTAVAQASDHMTEEFLRHPALYVAPHLYLGNASNFANPVMRKVYESGGVRLGLPKAQLEEKGYIVQWSTLQDGEELILSLIEPYALSKFAFLAPKDVDYLSTLIGLTDFLFAETGRTRDDVQRPGHIFFSEKRLIPFDVLS